MGSWFEIYSYWETIAAQILAVTLVVGSYVAAERIKTRKPGAHRASTPPPASEPS
jgi:high-affinity iron transporter